MSLKFRSERDYEDWLERVKMVEVPLGAKESHIEESHKGKSSLSYALWPIEWIVFIGVCVCLFVLIWLV